MFWDWLYRILYWREIRDEMREMDEMAERWKWMLADLDRQIAEAFTPEEYAAVRERCEKQISQMTYPK